MESDQRRAPRSGAGSEWQTTAAIPRGEPGRPRLSTMVAIAIAVIAAGGIVMTLVAASRLPDLRLTSVRFDAASVAAGNSFEVTDLVTSVGAIASPPATTELCLSPSPVRRPSCLPLRGNRAIPLLSPGTQSADRTRVTIPPGTAAGRYFVIECVGNTERDRESNLRNNCLASDATVVVTSR